MKRVIRQIYVGAVPSPLRAWLGRLPAIRSLQRRYLFADTSLHDLYYTPEYYETDVMRPATEAADHVAADFVAHFNPKSAIDVGCGTGEYLLALRNRGVAVHGVDLAAAALAVCQSRGLDVQRFDLTKAEALPWQADLVYSFEVAEHLPPPIASRFVSMLSRAALQVIVITAAQPGQAGLGHQNCQPKQYWVALFAEQGWRMDESITTQLESHYRELGLAPWLCQNLMVFRR